FADQTLEAGNLGVAVFGIGTACIGCVRGQGFNELISKTEAFGGGHITSCDWCKERQGCPIPGTALLMAELIFWCGEGNAGATWDE
ncbi:hypothetical protein, partial [Escherichia coli]|uniref:hypothetical protein n=1 Tax=Escherichia coli TaxID=562 RepID=UPI00138716C2